MASTVDSKRVKEFFDDETELAEKLDTLTAMVNKSRHTVFFTGAGVSTSAGVRDYRGPSGAWTQRRIAQLQKATDAESKAELKKLLQEAAAEKAKAAAKVPSTDAQPTFTHMAMAKMVKERKAHYVITTNLDGIFRKAGLKGHDELCCLHGDIYIERCTGCGYDFERNYHVRDGKRMGVHDHKVGTCEKCGSTTPKTYDAARKSQQVKPGSTDAGTKDTHINFGENLDDMDWDEADEQTEKADLCIVMGTSMSLRHITHFPFQAKRTVICNLQATPDDKKADLRIWATCDAIMRGLFDRLGLQVDPVPAWRPRDSLPLSVVKKRTTKAYYEAAVRLMKLAEERQAVLSKVAKAPDVQKPAVAAAGSGGRPPAGAAFFYAAQRS